MIITQRMERLWTPWRMSYVTGAEQPAAECVMCAIAASPDDRAQHVLHRGDTVFVALNLFPYNTAHTLIAPYEHVGDFAVLSADVNTEMWTTTQRLVAAIDREYRPDGFNIGMNLGRVAGAGIPDHLHVHVVPRWGGDTNFMPVTADTKVLPESLDQTWERLRGALGAVKS
jgi:ATP adenylyltransferase